MYPVICQIGPFTVYSYGVSLAVAVIVCAYLLKGEAKKNHLNPQVLMDMLFIVTISGIVGARLFYIFLNLPYFLQNPAEVFMLHHGGLAWQGGLVSGFLATVFSIKKNKLPFLFTIDRLAPYIALGQSIGRIGCFFNGCCYGKEVAWGIYFPVHQARLHPTQLYDSLGLFIIFLALKKFQSLKKKEGEVFVLYLLSAAFLRFLVEFYRADHEIFLLGLSIFQVVSLGFILAAISTYLIIRRNK